MTLLTQKDVVHLQHELDETYKYEVCFELDNRMRQRLVEEMPPGSKIRTAAFGLVNGRYDDAKKDILTGRITSDEGISLLQKMLDYKLINRQLFDWHSQKFMEAGQVGLEAKE